MVTALFAPCSFLPVTCARNSLVTASCGRNAGATVFTRNGQLAACVRVAMERRRGSRSSGIPDATHQPEQVPWSTRESRQLLELAPLDPTTRCFRRPFYLAASTDHSCHPGVADRPPTDCYIGYIGHIGYTSYISYAGYRRGGAAANSPRGLLDEKTLQQLRNRNKLSHRAGRLLYAHLCPPTPKGSKRPGVIYSFVYFCFSPVRLVVFIVQVPRPTAYRVHMPRSRLHCCTVACLAVPRR